MSVYHGSTRKFDIAKPSFTARTHMKNGKRHINYEGISLHATPYKWIALSYTNNRQSFIKNGKKEYFNVGVSLFNNNKRIFIHGKRNLEYSLKKYMEKVVIYTHLMQKNLNMLKVLVL